MQGVATGRQRGRGGEALLLGFEQSQAGLDCRRSEEAADARRQCARHLRHRQLAGGRQQPVALAQVAAAGRQQRPFTLFVELADDARPDVLAPVVQFLLQLVLEQLPLLLDHQDLLEALGEAAHAVGFERPDHADLVQTDADPRREFVIDAELVERLTDVEVGLAGGDDAEARGVVGIVAVDQHAVELVGPAVRERRVQLVVEEPRFLLQRRIGPADVETVRVSGRHFVVVGDANDGCRRVDQHRC